MDALFDSPLTWLVLALAAGALVYLGALRWSDWRQPRLPDVSRDSLVDAMLSLATGERDQAARQLAHAIETQPDSPWPFLIYAALLNHDGEAGRAAQLLEGLLARRELDPALMAAAHEQLVATLARAGQLEEAGAWARSLSQVGALDDAGLERRARLALAARAYPSAQALAARLERQSRERGRALLTLAQAAEAEDLADAGHRDEALKLLKKATGRKPGVLQAWALEGSLRIEAGDLAKARAAFVEALVLEPALGLTALGVLEDAHIELGQVADYESMLHELLERRPRDPIALWALGNHHRRRRHLDQALRVLSEAVQVAPEFALAQRNLDELKAERDGTSLSQLPTPVPPCTRCQACGSEDVQGIVRCPVCGQVGEIRFLGGPPSSLPAVLREPAA